MEKRAVLYMHGGSANHGCEAIVNSTCHMVRTPLRLVTNSVTEDEAYSLAGLCPMTQEKRIADHKVAHAVYYGWRLISQDRESYLRYRFGAVQKKGYSPLYISIGGDNYCYDDMVEELMLANSLFHRRGAKTVLWGCSVEPALLKRQDVRRDMSLYDAIVARESLTGEALREAGVGERLFLFPDPAFCLEAQEEPLPEGFLEGKTVGINLSPMVIRQETRPGVTFEAYEGLIRYILKETDFNLALIPHVTWKNDDDRKPLGKLYERFASSGRVLLLPDMSAPRLKGYIGRCRLFIGARTHATIAAYSSLVPTLAIGYSVKARGIARDLFGSYEQYVMPVQRLQDPGELIAAFRYLADHESVQREKLAEIMPVWRTRAREAGRVIDSMWESLREGE